MAAPTTNTIRTRILILSDTHGHPLLDHDDHHGGGGFRRPLPPADVALHCGDLTFRSTPEELKTTLDVMREVDAPLKLVIPGNHDSSLDLAFWEGEIRSQKRHLPPPRPGPLRAISEECAALVQKARQQDNINVLVDEGTYHFVLPPPPPQEDGGNNASNNNAVAAAAKFTIFTSPWTPSYGRWGFQYDADAQERHFAIPPLNHSNKRGEEVVDVVMTHGPPLGILDATRIDTRAGCPHLLRAVARARPRLHCFGHIHEGAGAALVRWEEDQGGQGNDGGRVDEQPAGSDARAEVVAVVASEDQHHPDGGIWPIALRAPDAVADAAAGVEGNSFAFEAGKETLFVNAAIMTVGYQPLQSPWLVDLDLSVADEAHRARAEATRALLASS